MEILLAAVAVLWFNAMILAIGLCRMAARGDQTVVTVEPGSAGRTRRLRRIA